MKQSTLSATIALLVAGLVFITSSCFIVDQTKNAIVLQFGKMVRVIETPGLKLKVPFIQDVLYFDRQLLTYNLPITEVNAGDQKLMIIDMYVRYQITDVLKFYRNVGKRATLQDLLAKIIPDIMQEVIGRSTLSQLLSEDRIKIMNEIQTKIQVASQAFGISINGFRNIRIDLPSKNSEAIFKRMESERRQEARQIRAEGDESAQGIRAKAERERTVLLAEANKQSEILRGEGDAKASDCYGQAFSKDREFFRLYRSLSRYKDAIKDKDTTMILPLQHPYFKYMTAKEKP